MFTVMFIYFIELFPFEGAFSDDINESYQEHGEKKHHFHQSLHAEGFKVDSPRIHEDDLHVE